MSAKSDSGLKSIVLVHGGFTINGGTFTKLVYAGV